MKLSTFQGHLTINATSQAQKTSAVSHKPHPVIRVCVHITHIHISNTFYDFKSHNSDNWARKKWNLKKKVHSMVTKNHQFCQWLNEHTPFIFLAHSSANKSITFLRSCPVSAATGAERWPWTKRKVPNNSIHICLFVSSARVVNLARTADCVND
jgi:hypothetical protein